MCHHQLVVPWVEVLSIQTMVTFPCAPPLKIPGYFVEIWVYQHDFFRRARREFSPVQSANAPHNFFDRVLVVTQPPPKSTIQMMLTMVHGHGSSMKSDCTIATSTFEILKMHISSPTKPKGKSCLSALNEKDPFWEPRKGCIIFFSFWVYQITFVNRVEDHMQVVLVIFDGHKFFTRKLPNPFCNDRFWRSCKNIWHFGLTTIVFE